MDNAELLLLRQRFDALKEAEKVKLPQQPNKPFPRVIQVSDFHKKAAAKLNTCPHELEAILQHAILTDNVMVQKAFKDFVMKAKLSLDEDELPLDNVRKKLKDCEIQNDAAQSNYEQNMLNYHAAVVRIQQDVDKARSEITQHWTEILDYLKGKVTQHKKLDDFRVWDRCAVKGIMFFYKDVNRESDAPPKCPLGRYKGGVRCSEEGWKQLADLPIKQIPDVIASIRSEFDGWKREYLNKHVLTEQERQYIFKSVGQGLGHLFEEYQQYGEAVDYEPHYFVPNDLYAKYDLWIRALHGAGTDGADGITPNEVREYINRYVREAVFHWEMIAVKERQTRTQVFNADEWGNCTTRPRRMRVRTTGASSSNAGGAWVYDEDGHKVFVTSW